MSVKSVDTLRTITQPELEQVQSSRERTFMQKACGVVAKIGLVGGAALYLTSKYIAPYFMSAPAPAESNYLALGAPNPEEEARGFSFPHREVELAADISLATGLVSYVADPIVGGLQRLCSSSSDSLETFYTDIKSEVALTAYAKGDQGNRDIEAILRQGPTAVIDNIKWFFSHGTKRVARIISENGKGKELLKHVYDETIKAMGLTQAHSGALSGTLHEAVTKKDVVQMVVALRRYGLTDQAAALENYATSKGVASKEEVTTEMRRVNEHG